MAPRELKSAVIITRIVSEGQCLCFCTDGGTYVGKLDDITAASCCGSSGNCTVDIAVVALHENHQPAICLVTPNEGDCPLVNVYGGGFCLFILGELWAWESGCLT